MGPEAIAAFQAAAPYLLAGGTAASMYGQHQQQKEQRGIVNRSMEQADRTQKKAVEQTLGVAQEDLSAQSRLRQMQGAEEANFARTQGDLQGAGADLIDTAQPTGGSQQFLTAKADRATQEGDRMTTLARELAKVRSSDDVQMNGGIKLGRLAEELGSKWNSQRANSQAAQMDAQDVGVGAIGQLGKIAQIAGAAGLFGGAAPAATAGSSDLALAAASDAGLTGVGANAGQAVSTGGSIWSPASASIFGQPQRRRAGARQ